MESRDLVSARVAVSVSKVSGLETLNIAKKWFIKISIIQRFLLAVFAGKNNQNTSEKCQKLEKNSSQKWWRHFFRQYSQILKSRVSVSNFKSRVSVSEFLMKYLSRSRLKILTKSRSRSRRLRSRVHYCWMHSFQVDSFWACLPFSHQSTCNLKYKQLIQIYTYSNKF